MIDPTIKLPTDALDASSGWLGSADAAQSEDPFRALRRKSAPSNLQDATLAWMARLPREVQPRTLAHRYARIANQLAALWKTGHLFDAYLDDLLVDRRGNRQGFPAEIAAELKKLARYHHARQRAAGGNPWAHERLSRF